jgi:hypothetical protein
MIPAPVTTRSKVARISLVVAYIAMVLGPVSLCTCGTVLGGALAAVLGVVPVLVGPARFRVLGAFPLVLGVAMSVHAYPQFREEMRPYAIRGELREVVELGTTIATALDRHRPGAKSAPGSIDELGVPLPREKVASVEIRSADQFAITLAIPAASGKELVFVAATVEGMRTWKCRSRGLEHRFRPTACREDADVATEPDRK